MSESDGAMTLFESRRAATFEEVIEWIRLPENADKRFELADGEIVEAAPSRKKNSIIAGRIIHFLNTWVIPKSLGVVTVPDAGFKVAARGYRQPDVGFVAQERVGDLDALYFEGAPDLAVEIVSEDEDIFRKAREYLTAGSKQVWAVYPDEYTICVFTYQGDGELLAKPYHADDTIEGGDVLPGFSLSVRDIFPQESE